jgi:hypothetical protein
MFIVSECSLLQSVCYNRVFVITKFVITKFVITKFHCTLINSPLFLCSGFDSAEVEKSAEINMFVLTDSRPQRLLLAVDGDLHVGRVELGLDVVPLAVADQDVASQLDDPVTLRTRKKEKKKSFFNRCFSS